jgi:hypothetical protein
VLQPKHPEAVHDDHIESGHLLNPHITDDTFRLSTTVDGRPWKRRLGTDMKRSRRTLPVVPIGYQTVNEISPRLTKVRKDPSANIRIETVIVWRIKRAIASLKYPSRFDLHGTVD